MSNKNMAPKYLEGDYRLTIKGNCTLVVSDDDGNSAVAKCHPDDEFDVGAGVKVAMEKLKGSSIKIGDRVEIIDSEKSYTTLLFTTLNDFIDDIGYIVKYRYGVEPRIGTVGTVVGISMSNEIPNMVAIYCEAENEISLNGPTNYSWGCRPVYVIGINGVKKL